MKKLLLVFLISILSIGAAVIFYLQSLNQIITPQPQKTPNTIFPNIVERFPELLEWKRPDGPPKVALQVGHWRNDQVPEELDRIRNNTGASWGNISEWEVNYEIATRAEKILEQEGIQVELLPATIPPSYWADAFVAIHADGNTDTNKSGFKVAAPRRDYSGKSNMLASYIEKEYKAVTDMKIDPIITRNMTGYYAFSWWRFDHAIHPMTAGIILETGFLTSFTDRLTILDNPDASAQGLASGIIEYLKAEKLI